MHCLNFIFIIVDVLLRYLFQFFSLAHEITLLSTDNYIVLNICNIILTSTYKIFLILSKCYSGIRFAVSNFTTVLLRTSGHPNYDYNAVCCFCFEFYL